MEKINVHFQNCYGIRTLDAQFDFSEKRGSVIYAPNGMMKTSFAETFKDHSKSQPTTDRVYTDRTTVRTITDENNREIPATNVLVIGPYDPAYESNRVSTLLANKELRAEYDSILKELDTRLLALMKKLRRKSGVKSGLEDIYSVTFTRISNNILRAFERIRTEVIEDKEDNILAATKYNTLFSERIVKLLEDGEVREALEEYTSNYDELVNRSRFFRKGIFNHYDASQIARHLKNHGFFRAEHKVYFHSTEEDRRVETEEELAEVINSELQSILSDEELRKSFDKIDKKLTTIELRGFREFLLNNQTLIPRLRSPDLLKEDLLKSYLIMHRESFKDLMDEYDKGKRRIEEITKEASEQATKWQDVIDIYNRRFSVPFTVVIENKEDVILKRITPTISFSFEDEQAVPRVVERDRLVGILSSGEQRALYILNVIFEVEARRSERIPTILVIDDIADSFDYKNKYAIVEYLNDMLMQDGFKQIILTHNYDFYRTVWRRLGLSGANYHVARTKDGISLEAERMYRDPFQRWREMSDRVGKRRAIIAMIPFVRNLAEYCGYECEYGRLTSVLHIKPNSAELVIGDLRKIYSTVLNGQDFDLDLEDGTLVVDQILETACEIAGEAELALDLERKIILSIAIRLLAERFMIAEIDDMDWIKEIRRNQTSKLTKKYKEIMRGRPEKEWLMELMDRVSLMTPENIHLNSFMYEPILDMSSTHLCQLHSSLTEI